MSYRLIDGHCDTVRLFEHKKNIYDFRRKNGIGHLDLPRLKEAGVMMQIFALYIEEEYKPVGSLKRSLALLDLLRRNFDCCRNSIKVINNQADLAALEGENRVGALISIEGGEALEGEAATLRMLFQIGIRGLGLTWNQENQLATGVGNGVGGKGLTGLGRKVVREMNRLGMIVDLAHINERGFYDTITLSGNPVIVSHANARSLCDHPRNLSDEQLKELAAVGGMIGLSYCPDFVDEKKATVDRLLDHFVHVAEVAGVDHLGLGSDFDGIEKVIPGLEEVTNVPALVEKLGGRGFSPDEIEKITAYNFLRVLKQILPA